MDFSLTDSVLPSFTGTIVIPVNDDLSLYPAGQALDRSLKSAIKQILKTGDFSAQLGQAWLLPGWGKALRILLIGVGPKASLSEAKFIQLCQSANRALQGAQQTHVLNTLSELAVNHLSWRLRQMVRTTVMQTYQYAHTKSKTTPKINLKKIELFCPKTQQATCRAIVAQARAIGIGSNFTRDLANLPANYCTPTYLAQQAKALAKHYGKVQTKILGLNEIKKLKMGAFLAVTAGSKQPPQFICVEYKGSDTAPIVLVGKGITFDSGGISLKPGPDMDFMKYDMSGAASVLGTIKAAAELKLPIHVVGLIPTCENLPGGSAVKPGDVVTSMAGITIEILNTDAEGRLILCDALHYARRYKPKMVIDIATLTGAMVIALGSQAAGLFTSDDAIANGLQKSAEATFDRIWRMPLWPEYNEVLESNFADLPNIGDRQAGSITAACFLQRFVDGLRWAHLDIAGVAYVGGREKGATGRPVALLTQFLIDQV